MISEFVAWLFTLLVLNPLNADLRQKIDEAGLPVQAFQQSQQCITSHAPRLLERATEDPAWAAWTVVSTSVGWTPVSDLLDEADPNCAAITKLLQNENTEETEV
jgi:hypothetical protein